MPRRGIGRLFYDRFRTYGFGRFAMGGFQLEEPFIDRIEVNAPVTAKFKGGDLTIL